MAAAPTPNMALVVAATSRTLGMGKNGGLPWKIKTDMSFFARITKRAAPAHRNAVIMGRKTWESIPQKFRPLPERLNIILTRQREFTAPEGVIVAGSLDESVEKVKEVKQVERVTEDRIYVIGGAEIYRAALEEGKVRWVVLTRLKEGEEGDRWGCDTFFPVKIEGPEWVRRSHEELCRFCGEEVPEGMQKEGDIEFEFELWEKRLV